MLLYVDCLQIDAETSIKKQTEKKKKNGNENENNLTWRATHKETH